MAALTLALMGRGEGEAGRRSRATGPRKWTDQRIKAELAKFVEGKDSFPTKRQFHRAGQERLWRAIREHGGVQLWAPRVGLPLREAQRRQGLSEAEAVRQAGEVIAEHGHLPGADKLRTLGHPKLATYIYFAGGARRFLVRHGLESVND
jgi:hypothetical protein